MFKLPGSCLKLICLGIFALTEFQSHYEHLNLKRLKNRIETKNCGMLEKNYFFCDCVQLREFVLRKNSNLWMDLKLI